MVMQLHCFFKNHEETMRKIKQKKRAGLFKFIQLKKADSQYELRLWNEGHSKNWSIALQWCYID